MSRYLCSISVNRGCVVTSEISAYPYDSWYKQKYPDYLVYKCSKHNTWWINANT